MEGYTAGTHPEKLKKLQGCLKPAVFDWVKSSESGQPDLFVYTPGTDDWFFCEVKGPRDKLRENQLKWRADFEDALAAMKIPIKGRYRVLCLKELNDPVREGA